MRLAVAATDEAMAEPVTDISTLRATDKAAAAPKPNAAAHQPPPPRVERVATPRNNIAPSPALVGPALALTLLSELRASTAQPSLPVQPHAKRLNSGHRGLSRKFLAAIRELYGGLGALDKAMADVCKEAGFDNSVCALTRCTGLSLAESIVHVGGGREGIDALVGKATTFFSYSWTGTHLDDMLYAVERQLASLEAADGVTRYVWVDMFCASQTLLAGMFLPEGEAERAALKRDSSAYAARKEDTNNIFDDAIEVVGEILFYCSPLTGEWRAPAQPYLRADRGEPRAGWMRKGPGAATRAWCIFELAKTIAKGCTLHVVLSRADVANFERLLTHSFEEIAGIVAAIDANDAQISKVEDRDYILGEVAKLGGGLGEINATVCGALRGWLAREGRAALERLPAAERGTSALINKVAMMLQKQGDLAAAAPLYREALDAKRETLGAKHPSTLASINNLGLLLKEQGDLAGAAPLLREALDGQRETLGAKHPSTLISIFNFALLLGQQGEESEAKRLCQEAVDGAKEVLGVEHPHTRAFMNNNPWGVR